MKSWSVVINEAQKAKAIATRPSLITKLYKAEQATHRHADLLDAIHPHRYDPIYNTQTPTLGRWYAKAEPEPHQGGWQAYPNSHYILGRLHITCTILHSLCLLAQRTLRLALEPGPSDSPVRHPAHVYRTGTAHPPARACGGHGARAGCNLLKPAIPVADPQVPAPDGQGNLCEQLHAPAVHQARSALGSVCRHTEWREPIGVCRPVHVTGHEKPANCGGSGSARPESATHCGTPY